MLASFAATAQDNAILIAWQTVSEIDNLGFNLYRTESPDGPPTQLHAGLIPSQVPPGSPVGAAYTWLDETAAPGVTYYYWLEDVDAYGVATGHGPVEATVQPAQPQPPVPKPFRIFLPRVNK